MKRIILSLLILVSATCSAQIFDDYFENKTLRLDYIFSGTKEQANISLHQQNSLPQWWGRTKNLSTSLLGGYGQISVTDKASGELIYIDAFSTLFQEWLDTDESSKSARSFENTLLVPYPRAEAIVEVKLRNRKGGYDSYIKHEVNPDDILIRAKGENYITPYNYLHKGADVDNSINVVIVGEGYTLKEMDKLRGHAETACNAILAHQPFSELKGKFNFILANTASEDSGVSIPQQGIWKNSIFSSHFDTFYSERYLTSSNVFDLHDALAGVPYSHIIILANTDTYGGGGILNAYTLTTTGNSNFEPVVVHEFGHSFAGLADEYFYENQGVLDNMYPTDVEPWEANITTLVDFDKKWKSLVGKKKFGQKIELLEGGGYSSKGVYRSREDCRMRTNTAEDFCPVCRMALEELIHFYTE